MIAYIVTVDGVGAIKGFKNLDRATEYAHFVALSSAEFIENSKLRITDENRIHEIFDAEGNSRYLSYIDKIEIVMDEA